MDDDNESDIDESALESELEAILSGKAVSKPRPKKKGNLFHSPLLFIKSESFLICQIL